MDITDAITAILDIENYDRDRISVKLGVTKGQISHYLTQGKAPRLNVAGRIWGHYQLVVEPFTEKAVIKQWTEEKADV